VLLMEPHRQSTAVIGTIAGMATRPAKRLVRAKPRRAVWFLKAWRKYRGLSQEALGAKVGLTQGMISQLEDGTSNYTRQHLEELYAA